ncbi:MAG: FAD-dependent oxidoreductase [bacterium]
MMNKKLVLIGGGHAHMATLANIENIRARGHELTVIAPSEHHYYSGMGPGMLGKTYTPDDIRFRTRRVVEKQGGIFVLDTAVRIEAENRMVHLKSGRALAYDVLSCNAGSFVPQTGVVKGAEQVFASKPIERLQALQKEIIQRTATDRIAIGIIGGGPSAAEISGNIWQLVRKQKGIMPEITIFSGSDFFSRFSHQIGQRIRQILTRRGIQILEGDYAKVISDQQIILASGKTVALDLVVLAFGVRPSTLFADSGLPVGPDGGLAVNQFLQNETYPELFGGGDCIHFLPRPLNKVGVYAVRQNNVLLHNLLARLEGKPLQAFDPGGDYLLIYNLGGGQGVFHKNRVTFKGRLAFSIKDYIDRKFMKKFQAIE